MIHSKRPLVLSITRRNALVLLLAFLWILGLASGAHFASAAGDTVSSLMRTAALSRVSIVGLAVVLTFPLIISGLAVHFSVTAVFFPLAFIKAFSFSYCLVGIAEAFGSAGWLLRFLLVFSDSCMIVPLIWFWVRHLSGHRDLLRRDLTMCGVAAAVLGSADYFLVSPFLVMLMN